MYHEKLMHEYFEGPNNEGPLKTEHEFRKRFRVPRGLFMKILNDLVALGEFDFICRGRSRKCNFNQTSTASGKSGYSPHQIICTILSYVCLDISFADLYDYYGVKSKSASDYMYPFFSKIVELYEYRYFNPNKILLKL